MKSSHVTGARTQTAPGLECKVLRRNDREGKHSMSCSLIMYTSAVGIPEVAESQSDAISKYCDAERFDVQHAKSGLQ